MIGRNLDIAGLGTMRLRAAVVCETGKGALEIPAIWLRPHDRVARLVVEASGWEHVETAAKAGRGLIFLTPHLGCFEMTGQYIASRMPITVMYSPPNIKALEPLDAGGPRSRRRDEQRSGRHARRARDAQGAQARRGDRDPSRPGSRSR